LILLGSKLYAFIRRDFLSMISYRLAFLLQVLGMFFSIAAFYFLTKMIDPDAEGLDGIRPFEYLLVGLAFLTYFSTALYAFAAKIRKEQMMGTLEAMLVAPTPTSIVIFASAAWDFTWGAFRIFLYLLIARLAFGLELHVNSLLVLAIGVVLTLLSSAGVGILSASFILYFKRGDPINFLLSGATTFLGSVFFPVEQLPEWLQGFSKFVPLAWSLRVVRGALLQGKSFAELRTELLVLAGLTVVLLPLGLWASRFAIRKAKSEGSLIQY
jgi:ABC-2 type transport system permease protein